MKITKTKEVVIEEIEVLPGTYYFECSDGLYHKIIIDEEKDETTNYILESVENFLDVWGIRVRKDWSDNDDNIPYKFSAFIRGISGKKTEKEEFEQQKQEVIKRITEKQMILTTKDINGEDIKVLVDDSVGKFIRMNAIVEQQGDLQKTYKINNIVYTFDDER